ncbi:MAG: hypothetical protein JWN98_2432 [Abditibacteriota bacterium]|nr:hypothetical protein [Abditibacteriota bacterium]
MCGDLWNKKDDAGGLIQQARSTLRRAAPRLLRLENKNFACSAGSHYNERLCLTPGFGRLKMSYVNRGTQKEQAKSLVATQTQGVTHLPMRLNSASLTMCGASGNESLKTTTATAQALLLKRYCSSQSVLRHSASRHSVSRHHKVTSQTFPHRFGVSHIGNFLGLALSLECAQREGRNVSL